MSILDRLSSSLGKRDTAANKAVAKDCAAKPELLTEVAVGFSDKSAPLRGDCAEVFAETSLLNPEATAPHIELMLAQLNDHNNRVRWEILMGISAVAPIKPAEIFAQREQLLAMAQTGSVIVKDGAVLSLSRVAGANGEYRQALLPELLELFTDCRPKDTPRYGEYISEAVADDSKSAAALADALEQRIDECTNKTALGRVYKLLKKLGD